MKKIVSILLSGMIAVSLLIGCSSTATEDNAVTENQITESVEYTSLKEDETHVFDKELIKDDGTYTLKDVMYETVSKSPVMETKTVEIKDLYEQNVEAEQEKTFINMKGKEVLGKLSDVSYSDIIITNRTAEIESTTQSGYVISQPTAANSKTVNYVDEAKQPDCNSSSTSDRFQSDYPISLGI